MELAQWIMTNGSRYGIRWNTMKWYGYMPQHNLEADVQLTAEWGELQSMGVQLSRDGLPRLLGVPIGKLSYVAAEGNHLDKVTEKALGLIDKIMQMTDVRAMFGMLA